MARVIDPLRSSAARGSVGGLTYNYSEGAHIVKTRSGPGIYNSPNQIGARAVTHYLNSRWAILTDAQRAAWNQFAIDHPVPSWTGGIKPPNGHNAFVKCNWWKYKNWSTYNASPPDWTPPPAPTNFRLQHSSSHLVAYWDTDPKVPPGSSELLLWWVPAHPATRVPNQKFAVFLFNPWWSGLSYWGPVITTGRYTVWAQIHRTSLGLRSTFVKSYVDFP